MSPFYMYSEPLIIPPPPPGVQTVTDCGQPGVYVDNTDPINPVVCFGGVITDATLTGNGTLALPLSVVPPNIQVNIGKALYVSDLGDDATAVPYDIKKHYKTIQAAYLASGLDDVIVVYPGTYTLNGFNLAKDRLNYFFHPGATVVSNGDIFFLNANENCHVKGYGIFNNNGNGRVVLQNNGTFSFDGHQCIGPDVLAVNGGNCTFNVDIIHATQFAGVFFTGNSTATVNVREYIRAAQRCVNFYGNCNAIVNVPTIFNDGVHNTYNPNVNCLVRIQLTTGKGILNCSLGYATNGNISMITCGQINDGGSAIINIKRLINNYNGGTTHTIFIANKCNYFQFNGNIYSNAAGQNIGLYYLNTNAVNLSYIEFNGNMYVNTNYAILISGGGCTYNHHGDIYGNSSLSIATTPIGYGTLVNIVRGANGWQTSTATFNSSKFYQKAPDAIAVYKDMQLDGGGNEINNNCNLLDCSFWLNDDSLPVCDGLWNIVKNEYVTQGCIGNAGFGPATALDATGLYYQYPLFILQPAPIAN